MNQLSTSRRGQLPDQAAFGLDPVWLAERYHPGEAWVRRAARELSAERFLRLFVTAHGMAPVGNWQTHTYARLRDSSTGREHFFLIPMPRRAAGTGGPRIEMRSGRVWIDGRETSLSAQSIPYTTPFWYFHYDPNTEERPFASMTLNLSPSCLERCALCAGARTGRVNNGMQTTLSPHAVLPRIFAQHPEAADQLESVAVVTGCFPSFDDLTVHLREVREAVEHQISPRAAPMTFRVLEHNVTNERELDIVVRELGYDVFVTLECFDQRLRQIALNGKAGKKGRDSRLFLEILRRYAEYLDAHPELGRNLVRVTYLLGIDSLATTECFFAELARLNRRFARARIVPWLSIFTPYNAAMRSIEARGFGLEFVMEGMALARKYFGDALMESESGGTGDGYARGLF